MKKSICHYSFHRTWKEKNWDCDKLADAVKALGVEGIDFHARLLGSTVGAPERILSSLKRTGLTLSGLSLSNDFNQEDPELFKKQVETVIEWIRIAAKAGSPVSRIFGGNLPEGQRSDEKLKKRKMSLILDGLEQVIIEAEKEGVVLALENHGGLPCTGEEQVEMIKKINSKFLRATIDVGNYLEGGQEGHAGTSIAAPYAAYIHFKDFKKIPDNSCRFGWKLQACTVGSGDIDHQKCLKALTDAGYDGFVALEYEGIEGEAVGISDSVAFMNKIMEPYRE